VARAIFGDQGRSTSSSTTPIAQDPASPDRPIAGRLHGALCLLLAASSPGLAQIEGYGRVATGGAGGPVCTVTSSAERGPGTWDWCVQKGGNQTIQFAVSSATVYATSYLKSNTTVDGCANGRHGVTLYQPADRHRTVAIQGPASNVIVRCVRFQSTGKRPGYVVEEDLLRVDGTGGGVSKVAVNHCTFVSSTDGALDITGKVSDVTASWNLFYGTPLTQLIKYGLRQRISLHHNVYTSGGERNPQIKGNARDIDFVSNVVWGETVSKDAVGNTFNPYGTRIWNAAPGSDSPGNVKANIRSNVYGGANAHLQIVTEPGASAAGIYIAPDNVCAGGCHPSPAALPNAVPAAYDVKATPVGCMASHMVAEVGSPNRTTADHTKLDAVIAALPDDCPTLTVARAGNGRGLVSSSPAGISCGSDCSQGYASGTVVTLEPTPAPGSGFAGWSGACSGTGTCRVTMAAARSVTAIFKVLYPLTVAKTGGGIVTSTPAGITCGLDCTQSYTAGTVVSLKPTPASGSAFVGWTGACRGAGTCEVTMAAAESATATFKVLYLLTVAKAGGGSGGVTSSPAGIGCGSDCTQRYTSGAVVTLRPTPAAGSSFAGWSGACGGTGSCTVTMNAAKLATASFASSAKTLRADAEADAANAKDLTTTSSPPSPGGYYTLAPCRALDTRTPAGSYGAPALAAGESRVFSLVGTCGIPASARAVSVNLTVTQPTMAGVLRVYPADVPMPLVFSLVYAAGQTRSNAFVAGLSPSGALAIRCTQAFGTAHVTLDVTGYFE
jgi:hypothetical protein